MGVVVVGPGWLGFVGWRGGGGVEGVGGLWEVAVVWVDVRVVVHHVNWRICVEKKCMKGKEDEVKTF